MQLAIDTSTDTASIALAQDGEILAELTWHCGQNHTTGLLPNLTCLLDNNRLNIQSISAVIVARGPGSLASMVYEWESVPPRDWPSVWESP